MAGPAEDAEDLAPSYYELVRRNRHFRLLWFGEVISFLGDWFSLLALYIVVQEITDSRLALAGVMIGKTLPIFVVSPLAGPIVDRFDRRWLMIITDLVRAVLVFGLIAAHQLHSLPLLYVIIAAQVAMSGIFIPARSAVIPQITSPGELAPAMALSAGTWSIMLAVGAAIGGVLTDLVGPDNAFLLDGATYVLSAAVLWGLPALRPTPSKGEDGGTFSDGVRFIRSDAWVSRLLILKPAMTLQSAAIVLIPIFGNGTFPRHAGAMWVGLLYSVRGLGAFMGSIGTRRFTGDTNRAMKRAVPVAFVFSGFAFALLAYAPNIWIAGLGILLAAIGTGTVWVFSSTMMQRATEDGVRGRVFAIEWGALTLTSAFGSALAGGVSDGWGLSERDIVLALAVYLAGCGLAWAGLSRGHPKE